MTLPVIPDLPIPPLPIEIPLLMHPVVAHFAIVIPVVVLLLELANLIAKKRAISITSLSFVVLMMVIYVGLFITGKTDGSEGAILLSDEGLADFKAHKLLGLYLIYSTAIIFLFKLVAMLVQKPAAKIFFVVLLIGFVGVNMYQGKEGGELVYKFGMNNAALNEANDKLEEMTYELDDLKAELESAKELTCKEVQESIDEILEEEGAKEALPGIESDENGVIDIENSIETTPDEAAPDVAPEPAAEPMASQDAA
jgi:uncharacterized membrane protein